MSWKSALIAVADSAAVVLFDADTDIKAGQQMVVKNTHATTTVYLGGPNVVASTVAGTANAGYPLAPGEAIGVDVANNRELGYARCATGLSANVAVLRVGA